MGSEDPNREAPSGDHSPDTATTGTDIKDLLRKINSFSDSGTIGIREGIAYGLGLMIYIVGLAVIATVFYFVSFALLGAAGTMDNIVLTFIIGLIAFVLGLLGFVAFSAGLAGLQYKIIADAVDAGTSSE